MDKSAKKSISREITFLSDGYKLKGNLHMPATARPPEFPKTDRPGTPMQPAQHCFFAL
jgi:hypothetical protein